jgi:AcrR family transcriptional regulator
MRMDRPARPQGRTPTFDKKLLHLLEAAARVFADVGYERASMRRIAAEADVSLAGIYHYVASKEEILYWIQSYTFDSLNRGLAERLTRLEDPRARLAAVVANHIGHFGENMNALKVCAQELDTLSGEAYEAVSERRRDYFNAVYAVVKELEPVTSGRLDPWLATANLFGMLNWFYQWWDPERSRFGLEELAAQQAALFLDGFAQTSSTGGRDL